MMIVLPFVPSPLPFLLLVEAKVLCALEPAVTPATLTPRRVVTEPRNLSPRFYELRLAGSAEMRADYFGVADHE